MFPLLAMDRETDCLGDAMATTRVGDCRKKQTEGVNIPSAHACKHVVCFEQIYVIWRKVTIYKWPLNVTWKSHYVRHVLDIR